MLLLGVCGLFIGQRLRQAVIALDFGDQARACLVGRLGRGNPKTGATIQIAAKRAPKFSPAKALKDAAAA